MSEETLVYKRFADDAVKPPVGATLARPMKKGHPNVCCLRVENPNAWRSKGWSETLEAAAEKPVEKVEVEEPEPEKQADDGSE